MPDEKQPRRVKATEGGTHRTGTLRAAIKPHKRATEPNVKQAIADYMATVKQGSVSQTYYGATITQNASSLRANFGLAADDEPYLLVDAGGTGRSGMLLSKSGLHLADGRGTKIPMSWADFAGCQIGCQRGMLVIGQNGIVTKDAQVALALLQQIQAKLAK